MKIYAAKTSDSIILEKIIDMLDKDRQEKVLRFKNIEERNIYLDLLAEKVS